MKKILILIILFLLIIGGKVVWGQNPPGDIESEVKGVCDEVANFLKKKKFIVYKAVSGELLLGEDIAYEFFLWELRLISGMKGLSVNEGSSENERNILRNIRNILYSLWGSYSELEYVRSNLYGKLEGKPELGTLRDAESSLIETGVRNACYLTFLRILVARGKKLLGVTTVQSISDLREAFKDELLPDEETIRKKGISISYNTLVSTTTEFYNELKQIVYDNLPPKLPDNIDKNIKQCILNMTIPIVQEEQSFALNHIINKYIIDGFYRGLGRAKLDLNKKEDIDKLSIAVNGLYSRAENVKGESEKFLSSMLNKGKIFIDVLNNPNSCTNPTTQQEFRQAVQATSRSMRELESELQQIFVLFETPAEIKVETTTVPIAVIPPIIFIDEHKGTSSFAELLPENIFEEIRNFIFKLTPSLFFLLLVVGGLYYLASPVDIKNIITGTGYIKYAVLGYFLLLVITAVITAIKTIFGGP